MAESAGGTCAVLSGAFNKDSYFNPLCKYNSKSKDPTDKDLLFTKDDKIDQKFIGYFNKYCFGKKQCDFPLRVNDLLQSSLPPPPPPPPEEEEVEFVFNWGRRLE